MRHALRSDCCPSMLDQTFDPIFWVRIYVWEYITAYFRGQFWCLQGQMWHLVLFYGLKFMCGAILQHNLKGEFSAKKVKTDNWSDFLF